MKAMVLARQAKLHEGATPLTLQEIPTPAPKAHEVLLKVRACGVCHTELDIIEGRITPKKLPLILGHQVIGEVVSSGDLARRFSPGARVGVGWIFSSTGASDENIAVEFRGTGCDADGGYAEYMTAGEVYAAPIPEGFSDEEAAPLLCAGAVGYRALTLCNLKDGEPLGLMGFGGSAHIVLQLVRERFPSSAIYVFARDEESRGFAIELGAKWAGAISEQAPERCRAIIDTTPAWKPVVAALANLAPGGRLVINAIRKEEGDKEELLKLSYHDHLWMEHEIKSVANVTHRDIEEFLPLAFEAGIRPKIEQYALEDANQALVDLKFKNVRGAKVLSIGQSN